MLYSDDNGANTNTGRFTTRAIFEKDLSAQTSYWPASACRSVLLQIAHYNGDDEVEPAGAFKSIVADPNILQLVSFQKEGRNIVYGTQCGIYATGNPVTMDPIGELLIKAAADYEKAWKDYNEQ